MSWGVGLRCSLDPALLWLWWRLAAVALILPLAWELLILPLAWEPPFAVGAAQRNGKKTKKKKRKKRKQECVCVYVCVCVYNWFTLL